ncbi:hypothetical protein LCGC14_1110650 [marine sediment metagenome]|uniref:Uncharacterized protein n=1 Tax=marine sediment metagenome TaxID=412755 RepID=A0A0F9ITW4_9ZZZZ|nr:MAG: hypothetical protein Lokiarch_21660 [Candidatus Lokiarchaeum sp. GC14_75]
MITVWVSPHEAIEMAKIYLKQPREIPFVTKWRVFNTTGGRDGSKQYHLIYTERGKLEEASLALAKYFLPLMSKLESFRWQSESLTGVSETFKLIGEKW